MAHTNILSRMLNREVINLGFSGNAHLDYEIAELMAERDASLYMLDFVPNCSAELILEKTERFYRILRNKHPDTPILFIETLIRPFSKYDLNSKNHIHAQNKALHAVFDSLKAKNEKNIYLIAADIGMDNEASVDGTHLTDLGFMRFAEYLYPQIRGIIGNIE
jgi:hypothetical protein